MAASGGPETVIINEYYRRKMLSDLGYQFSGDNLGAFKGECFAIIKNEIDKELARKTKPRKGKK